MARVLHTSLTELERNVRDRTQLENRHITNIKEGLSTIIRQLVACNRDTSSALRNDSTTDIQRAEIIQRINDAALTLRQMVPLDSSGVIRDLNRYSHNLTTLDRNPRAITRDLIFPTPSVTRSIQSSRPASGWWPFTSPSNTSTLTDTHSGVNVDAPIHPNFATGGYRSTRSLRKKTKRR
jgi:hypothetical protein